VALDLLADNSCRVVDIDTPLQPPTASGVASSEPSADQISLLADMGFTAAQAYKALRETVSEIVSTQLIFVER